MSTFVGIPRIPTAAPETEMDPQDARGVRMAVSVLLDYPGDDFETKLDAVEEALAGPAGAGLGVPGHVRELRSRRSACAPCRPPTWRRSTSADAARSA